MLIFDIETGPLSAEEIKRFSPPFEPKTKHPGEFSTAAVKLGHLKDRNKIELKIQEAREKHAKAAEEFAAKIEKEESDYWQEAIDQAALSALTGQVLAIGYKGNASVIECKEFEPDNEANMLVRFWKKFIECNRTKRPMVGFYSNLFDVPFLYQRSLILSVDVPAQVFDGKWLNRTFVDLADYWKCGNRSIGGKLDTIAKALGIGSKPDGVSGADFSRLYLCKETRHQAIEYLQGDLDMTWNFAMRVGLGANLPKPSSRVLAPTPTAPNSTSA